MAIFESVFTTFRKNRPYIFHTFCEEDEITHLCFADDLFILAHADVDSIKTIRVALIFFSEVTDSTINENKSLEFYGRVKEEMKANIYNIMGIAEGNFPAIKKLTYTGRIELVKSMVMGIISYWSQLLVLPKKVVKKLDALMRNFIKGSNGRGGKKVKWTVLCKPKEEGGIGLKNYVEWNKVLTCKHLLAIESKQESL
ncbi:uncharacterized protein LOC124924727 [Impatiens glandulifera]|uniref:uncharacterized protein LOC124924727 n=1 Tax=Impatiens glandulifera TaxID=253017 RepID=UPI001FB15DD0|nr:uncharacterized protein LOC124924727 [Impatiens glandulifera]